MVAFTFSCTSFDANKELSISSERAHVAHIIARHPDYASQVLDSIVAHPSNLNSVRNNKKLRLLMEKDSTLLVRMMENARLDTAWQRTFGTIMMNERPMMGSHGCMDMDDMQEGHGMGSMNGMNDKSEMKDMSGMNCMSGKKDMQNMKGIQQHKRDRKHNMK